MKWSTRVSLALALSVFAAAVFGITFLVFYADTGTADPAAREAKSVSKPPLHFATMLADSTNEAGWMKYWESSVEIGAKGRFDYWATNSNDQPVNVSVPSKNCQCTSAEAGIVDPAGYSRYEWNLALGGFLGSPGLIWNALGVQELSRSIEWKPLNVDGKYGNAVIPPARNGIPQVALLRLSWVGKSGESKERVISAEVMASLPNTTEKVSKLEAHIKIMNSFSFYIPGARGITISFGELGRGTKRSQELILWSITRPTLDLALSVSAPPGTAVEAVPHVSWTPLRDMTDDEMAAFNRELADMENRDAAGGNASQKKKPLNLRARSAQVTTLTLQETVEVDRDGRKVADRLDIGPWERRLTIKQGSERLDLPIRASVRGEIRMLGGSSEIDRVDFGQPFSAKQSKVKEVTILAEEPGTDLELVADPSTPDLLRVELQPMPPRDGKSQWTLKVTIPAGKLIGTLASSAAIVLQTKDAAKRKIRIPVSAQSHGGSDF